MIVLWAEDAIADLERHKAWLKTFPRAKPNAVIARIHAAAETMERLGDVGRAGAAANVRELSVRTDPYVIAYRVEDDVITVLAVYHTAQKR